MSRIIGGPRYDLGEVGRLVAKRRVLATKHVTSWLINHEYDAAEKLVELLSRLATSGKWTDCCSLANGEIADEYLVLVDAVEWYVKFYVDAEKAVVNVWSCWWEGTPH
jgi:hypothetical protein